MICICVIEVRLAVCPMRQQTEAPASSVVGYNARRTIDE